MSRTLAVVLNIVVWALITAYLAAAARYCSRQTAEATLTGVVVEVEDSDLVGVVTPGLVMDILAENGIELDDRPVRSIDTKEIEETLTGYGFISSSRVYSDLAGTVRILVGQRKPLVRVYTSNGYNIYLSEDGWALPVNPGHVEYVPVVTGDFDLPFDTGYLGYITAEEGNDEKKLSKNYSFLCKLINFVKLVSEDAFWNAQIVQINITDKRDSDWKEPEVELIPRAGDHVVVFGTLDEPAVKLEKLMLFYTNVLDHEGWDKYRFINVKYKDQVVCTNK